MRKRKAPAPARARAPAVSPPESPGGGSVSPPVQFIIPIEDRSPDPVPAPVPVPVPVPVPAPVDASPEVDYTPPMGYNTSSLELGLVLGLIMGLATVLIAACACFWCYRRRRRRRRRREDGGAPGGPKDDIDIAFRPLPSRNGSTSLNSSRPSSAHRPGTNIFTYEELETATRGFSGSNLLGQGGFGYVHRGVLFDGREVAVKQLKVGSLQGEREFRAEVDIIGRVHHRHLVSLLGYCHAGEERILVYEFLPNKTLNFHLHGKDRPAMSWETRMKIARGSALGLAYLHEDCRPKIIHRDIKAANILLDFNFEPKVADFGLAKFLEADAHVSTRIMGTFGYLAPEYASSGKVSHKSDVFSFGVLLLELLTGRRPVDRANPAYTDDNMVTWARPILIKALRTKILDELIDPKLQKNYDPAEIDRVMVCAALCLRHSPIGRPTMVEIVRALEGNLSFENLCEGMVPSDSSGDLGYNPKRYKNDMEKFNRQALEAQKLLMKF